MLILKIFTSAVIYLLYFILLSIHIPGKALRKTRKYFRKEKELIYPVQYKNMLKS